MNSNYKKPEKPVLFLYLFRNPTWRLINFCFVIVKQAPTRVVATAPLETKALLENQKSQAQDTSQVCGASQTSFLPTIETWSQLVARRGSFLERVNFGLPWLRDALPVWCSFAPPRPNKARAVLMRNNKNFERVENEPQTCSGFEISYCCMLPLDDYLHWSSHVPTRNVSVITPSPAKSPPRLLCQRSPKQ